MFVVMRDVRSYNDTGGHPDTNVTLVDTMTPMLTLVTLVPAEYLTWPSYMSPETSWYQVTLAYYMSPETRLHWTLDNTWYKH